MEPAISGREHDDKENIRPSSVKEINPVIRDCKLSSTDTKVKRKFRRPLRDITNLFVVGQPPQLLPTSFPDVRSHLVPPPAALNCRKRKVADVGIDERQNACSKVLRKEYR